MKLSEVLKEARTGAFIFNVSVKDARKVIANSTGELKFASTLFQKKYVSKFEGDEVVQAGSKETNITELKNVIKNHAGHEMNLRIGSINYSGIIEIDE